MSGAAIEVRFSFFEHGRDLGVPARQTPGAAGYDLLAAISDEEQMELPAGGRAIVPCGFAMALPDGFEAQIRPRSGLAARHGVTVLNAPGTVDSDYRGEVKVILINHGRDAFAVRRGDRIAQMVIAPVSASVFVIADSLEDTQRGSGGFGSTGHAAR